MAAAGPENTLTEFWRLRMELFKELMSSGAGIGILLIFVFMIGMGLYIWRMIARKMREPGS